MPDHSVFQGEDRIETFTFLGRMLRKGRPLALQVSDFERCRVLLKAKDVEQATAFLLYLHPLNGFMLHIVYEWLLRWGVFVSQRFPDGDEARQTLQEAFERWKEGAPKILGTNSSLVEAQKLLAIFLEPQRLLPPAHDQFLEQKVAGKSDALNEIGKVPNEAHAAALAHLQERHFPEALERFEFYFESCRVRHDLLFLISWSIGSVVLKRLGQAAAEEALQETLGTCSFNEMMWQTFMGLAPVERAAFLAEHLRNHFSGSGREGSVKIVEEVDRYRLVFDPCGSGGAMRRGLVAHPVEGFDILPAASVGTWGRTNEVPVYCAHCAFNEVAGIKRAGYPLWVTEFDPDPTKPCGWTVYKDSKIIPEHYYTRLGEKKP